MHDRIVVLRRQFSAAWRFRRLGIGIAWVVALVGWIAVARIPDRYESSARLYVDADAVLTPLLHGIALEPSMDDALEMLQRTLLSRPHLDEVIGRTDLRLRVAGERSREAMIRALARRIRVETQGRALFSVTYDDTEPRLARDVVRATIGLFLEEAAGTNRDQMANARQFLDRQIASYESQLKGAEQRRAAFKARYTDLLPSDADDGLSRLEMARRDSDALDGQLQDAKLRVSLLRADLATIPPAFSADTVQGVRSGRWTPLAEAERHLQDLRSRDTERNPDVVAGERLVASLRFERANAELEPPVEPAAPLNSNPAWQELRLRLVDATTEVSSLTRRAAIAHADRDRLESIARGNPGLQAELADLDRDYAVLRHDYEELLQRREAMRISSAAEEQADRLKLRLVDPPSLAELPVGPKRIELALAVLAAAIAAGAGTMIRLATLDSGFATMRELEIVGLPVLGSLSAIGVPARRPRLLLAGWPAAAVGRSNA